MKTFTFLPVELPGFVHVDHEDLRDEINKNEIM